MKQMTGNNAAAAATELVGKALSANAIKLRGAAHDEKENLHNAKVDAAYLNALTTALFENLKA